MVSCTAYTIIDTACVCVCVCACVRAFVTLCTITDVQKPQEYYAETTIIMIIIILTTTTTTTTTIIIIPLGGDGRKLVQGGDELTGDEHYWG